MESGMQGPTNLIGQVVGKYRIERMLGTGATGAVYLGQRLADAPTMVEVSRALPTELPELVAIKVLTQWQLNEKQRADFQARFRLETETLKRLRHPHIVEILDDGQSQSADLTYMVLRYLPGGTLAAPDPLRSQPYTLDDISAMLAQLADALDYAHRQGVIHRDIKPANILLDGRGGVYLTDFSIARLVAETQNHLTSTGRILGTPEYMAPEQVDGRNITSAVDIYALGMVVYTLVTGRPAFTGDSLVELVLKIAKDAPPAPRTLRPDLPEPAESAIMRALAKDPTQRFKTATEFAEAFALGLRGDYVSGMTQWVYPGPPTQKDAEAHTQPHGVSLDPQPTAPRLVAAGTRPPFDSRRLAIMGVALALIVACVAGAIFLGGGGPLGAFFAGRSGAPSGPLAQASATHTTVAATATKGHSATAPAAHPTSTPKPKSNTGGGGGGVVSAPTNTSVVVVVTATPTPTREPPTVTPKPPTPTPIPTHYETAGPYNVHTWTNYTNAGGTQGASVMAYQTVQVTCRVKGFQASGTPSGDYWWYRLTPSPWNNAFYAYADNFYNNGQTSGSLNNGVLVDASVPLC
ncbi:MAG TPA: serine/threonine-protein kinase [Ktedonobacterales bacterium]|nr:serine/threonine-protein kinase [Ktedonobacterales bacterium]